MFKRVDQFLPNRLNRLKVRKSADVGAVCAAVDQALDAIWNHAVPMRAVMLRGGRVTIAVISAAWGNEIATKEDRVIELANKRLRKQTVKELRTVISTDRAERQRD